MTVEAWYVNDFGDPVLIGGTPSASPQAPNPPSSLDATPGTTTVTLSWSPPSTGGEVDHYEVQRQTGPTSWVTLASPGGVSYTASGLTAGTSYTFRVRSVGPDGLVSAWVVLVVSTVASATRMVILAEAESSGAQSFPQLDARLAARVGTSAPLLAGRHSYSGSSFPATFAASTQQTHYNAGYRFGLLNVKSDWAAMASGSQDAKIRAFAASIPAGFVLDLAWGHEPENDGRDSEAGTWRAAQARIANVIAELDDPRLHYVVCHMAYTFETASGRNPEDWNPWPLMTAAAKARTIFGPDGYTKVTSTGGAYQSMDSKVGVAFTKATAWGAKRFAISEHALNNDVGASGAVCAGIWSSHILPWIRSKNLVYYAFYGHSGPAAGTSPYIDTADEETVMGNFAVEYRP